MGSSLLSLLMPSQASHLSASEKAHLVPVHSYGCKSQGRDMEGAVLCKPTDMAHPLPKDPGTVHKTSLKNKTISFVHLTTVYYRYTSSTQFLVCVKDTYKIAGSLCNFLASEP